jgi:hypothetical protein
MKRWWVTVVAALLVTATVGLGTRMPTPVATPACELGTVQIVHSVIRGVPNLTSGVNSVVVVGRKHAPATVAALSKLFKEMGGCGLDQSIVRLGTNGGGFVNVPKGPKR